MELTLEKVGDQEVEEMLKAIVMVSANDKDLHERSTAWRGQQIDYLEANLSKDGRWMAEISTRIVTATTVTARLANG